MARRTPFNFREHHDPETHTDQTNELIARLIDGYEFWLIGEYAAGDIDAGSYAEGRRETYEETLVDLLNVPQATIDAYWNRTPHPEATANPHHDDAVARLRAADASGEIDLAAMIVQAMTSAGAISEWDSGTIESVLGVLDTGPLPTVGSADDADAHRFWAQIADELGWHHDFEEGVEPLTTT